MDRTLTIFGYLHNVERYRIVDTYNGYGIYQRESDSPLFSHNEYAISNGKKPIVSMSCENNNKSDMKDIIDAIVYDKEVMQDCKNADGDYSVRFRDRKSHFDIDNFGKLKLKDIRKEVL